MVDGVEWWGPVTAISGAAVAVVAIAAAITRPFKSIRDEARQAHVLIGENINAVRIDLAAKIDGVRTELQADIKAVDAKIDGVRTELQADIKAVDAKVDGVRTDLTDLAKDVGELRVQVGRIDERTKASTEYRHAGTARVTDEPPS